MQRRLRLRAGDDGQLGVHGQPDPESAVQLVEALRSGHEVSSTRGPRLCTWREAERVLAGFPDGRVDEGPSAGPASLVGLEIARERGWTAPEPAAPPAVEAKEADA
ncbi:hypothetical protein [Nocardioides humi]|uniref:hypothetical protein n=1 Tax=Nocardioides humi TaxID=449461 RepID=UPI003CCC84F4